MLTLEEVILQAKLQVLFKGGHGSGDHGHAGRPGERGGSSGGSSFDATTREERAALQSYSGTGYMGINLSLRGQGGLKLTDKQADQVKLIDAAMGRHVLDKSMTVFRGIDEPFAKKLAAGTRFKDKAFVSTTADKPRARSWAGAGRGAIMQITVPKGASAIFMDHNLSDNWSEHEWLLDRNTTFHVTSVQRGVVYAKVTHG